MNIENRIGMEKQIIRKVLSTAVEHDLWAVIDNGECFTKKSQNVNALMKVTRETDEEHIILYTRNKAGEYTRRATFFLVYGNCGYDSINDYSDNYLTEMLMKAGIEQLIDKLDLMAV